MSIIDKKKLMLANMMLGGGLPMIGELVKESALFKKLKEMRVGFLAYRAEMKAKAAEIRRRANERIDALQAEANQQIDALQAEMDRRLEELDRAAEELFSDAGLEDLFEALKEPEPAPAAVPPVAKPSTVHVLNRPADPPKTE